jgi:hypothetical protein
MRKIKLSKNINPGLLEASKDALVALNHLSVLCPKFPTQHTRRKLEQAIKRAEGVI